MIKKIILKNFLIIIAVFLFISIIGSFFVSPEILKEKKEVSFSQLVKDIKDESISQIKIGANKITAIYKNGEEKFSQKDLNSDILSDFSNIGLTKEELNKIDIKIETKEVLNGWLLPLLISFLPVVILIGFFFILFRQAKGGAMQAFDFSKAKIRLFGAEGHPTQKISFKDVAGLKEAKQELEEIVDFLKNPQKYLKMGAQIPRGVLLVGPSGVGKTMLARAVAGESNTPFLSISGSEFVELFVGVGAARIRSLFNEAKKNQPSIVFIDELDAIGKMRGPGGISGGHEEREQTLNQLLVEMDGFERDATVIILAATNRPDVLDSALLRPGRFDRKVTLDLPDINEREEILIVHSRNKPLAGGINLREIAERTPGFSGAELANIANEAAILAARQEKKKIEQGEFLEAIEKVMLGPERKSHLLSSREKEITAYHEAGHALVASFLPEAEPVRKVSIIARGATAGYTLKMPSEDRRIRTKKQFLSEIAILLSGYLAEKIIFKDISTGASNDLFRATEIARDLVMEYGMSEKLGPISFKEDFSQREFFGRSYSEDMAKEIDSEVRKIIGNSEKEAIRVLHKKRKLLDKIAKVLIKKEVLEREEFEKLIKSK
ncbi:MAG: ATP-dependent zinc metalloprotease FtsH [bacterium]|nr:ATP-dependent zinc metalloprotease FtsH [bacterium]